MSFYIDATSMFETFATSLIVYPKNTQKDGHYEDGRWIDDPEPAPKTVDEPFIPMGRVSDYSAMLMTRDTGDLQRYSAEWLSKGKYEMGTAVIVHGVRYIVRDKDDYTSYSNLTIYYLQADDQDQKDGDEKIGTSSTL
ncbi:hypothetical protein [Lacticaseibacillus zhaodongensis]|uniref:hypothetical protein n=1 Tax=Lacticaseibacillus zhaodongensis TaxID=2668065 RepID=UPI0012D3233C|nr:hypothetical protein [Lacticaseibacillus zhaodongensis]